MSHIVLGSYNAADQVGIMILDVATDGSYQVVSTLSGIDSPSFLTQTPTHFYAVSETASNGGVVAINRTGTTLHHGTRRPSGGGWPCHIRVSGQHVVVSNYGSGSVALLRRGADGDIRGLNDLAVHHGTGPHKSRQDAPHAHSAINTPDGKYVIAADLGTDELVVYTIDGERDQLVRQHAVNAPAGNGPRHTIFHPNGQILYVANELACSVSVFTYNNGQLTHIADHSTITGANSDYTVADIHISADGQFLYCTTRTDNTIAAYRIGADGNLHRIGVYPCGGAWPRNFAIAPDGHSILVACQHDNHVAVLPRDPVSGAVGARVATIPFNSVSFVEFLG